MLKNKNMSIPQKVIKFLAKREAKYEPIKHRTVYTAYDKAATLRVPQKIVGKTLVVKLGKNLALVLIPANKNLDKDKLKKTAHPLCGYPKKVDFVSERIIKNKLKGVKVGAVPPFGSLWKITTFADRGLIKNKKIIVSGGDYNWSIKISSNNLKKIVPDLVFGNFGKAKK
ncbi:MAG: hypothetical protein COY73_00725 [Candidatus Nealsonbacteria bacterium CG_4_10_14_0_8_um_filter_37_14]|uniref:YbaK/aminoacyl-tRNA synthetase-associated domain-containing protein n=1 Tax=Candidatus Nealsonbacteria bacterium CG_4_10_14_0_8_um_filter_37_14 TaxID=1974684 RepID=A0A2M7R6Z0_9BACT|nr:MAG: hypothetical protein COV63_01710 [Candidatus Nealsonbacteria bacterium CG11_big_fil_rev_8_21_14_0_20_37_68]PIW91907.1 MAG: hypothetical protein COZ89_02620 [Candidatus Nealsonbacteria bacterium CG_4_8_14_3_um_filter_37_23]PIY89515.1 MAG: hypothetical protein COY73_00725 [Candidatus Nealsonbacteria bacterium CG_4_10_14_0_8_um_filter_37_14]